MSSPNLQPSQTVTTRRAMLKSAAAVAGIACACPLAWAAVPLENAKIVVAGPPGSTSDVAARTVMEGLNRGGYSRGGVVDNKTGGAQQIAIQYVKGQPGDGRSILLTPMSMLGIYPHTYRSLPYDPATDLAPVSLATTFDFAVAVGPAVPHSVSDINQLLAWFKANPSKASFGSPATGASPHFIGVVLGRAGGVELTHVGYRGTGPAIQDVLGGQLSAVVGTVGDLRRFVGSPDYRLLATTGAKRSRFVPDVPTLAEQGFADLIFVEWSGFYLPAKASADTVRSLNSALATVLADPDVIRALEGAGLEAQASSPVELRERLKQDTMRWGPIIKRIGFTADA